MVASRGCLHEGSQSRLQEEGDTKMVMSQDIVNHALKYVYFSFLGLPCFYLDLQCCNVVMYSLQTDFHVHVF